jgi:hypothetical protein
MSCPLQDTPMCACNCSSTCDSTAKQNCNICKIATCVNGLSSTSLYGNRYYSQLCRNRNTYYNNHQQILQNKINRLEYDDKKRHRDKVAACWITAIDPYGKTIQYNKITKEVKY